jgi:CubicO group peptidase (beta-lactamase class C family)
MKLAIAFLLIVSALSAVPATASDPAKQDIDRFVAKTLAGIPVAPAIGVSVVRDGRPFYAHAWGCAKLDPKTPATAATGFYIASTTKAFTGLACAILAVRGLVDLDAPITKYLPGVNMAPPLDAGKLTLRKFLTHTSGISNDAIGFRTAFTGEHTTSQLVELLNLSTPAPDNFQYDNLGYIVASLVIERVTGHPWQRALDELVFTPLGMKHTTARMSEAKRRPIAIGFETNRDGDLEPVTLVRATRRCMPPATPARPGEAGSPSASPVPARCTRGGRSACGWCSSSSRWSPSGNCSALG